VIRIKRTPVESRQVRRSQKRRADRVERSAIAWIRSRVSGFDHGIRVSTEGKKPHPIHCNKKEAVKRFFETKIWKLKKPRNKDFGQHFMGQMPLFGAGNSNPRDPETLTLIDIDCKKTGTLEGAKQFAEHLKETYFPGLYYEVSTNGNGIHAYPIIVKQDNSPHLINKSLKRLDNFLKDVLEDGDFDVENVEIKMTLAEIDWSDKPNKIAKILFGCLGKYPQDDSRFDEWKKTTRLNVHDLMRLPVKDKPKNKTGKRPPGSISGCHISEQEIERSKTAYLTLAKTFLENHHLATSNKSVAVAEDLSVMMMFLKYFSANMNEDGTLPWDRFRSLWEAVFESGDIERQFSPNRFAVLRNYLSSLGMIEWMDETYKPGKKAKNGKRYGGTACKWKASTLLLELMEGIVAIYENQDVGAKTQEGEEHQSQLTLSTNTSVEEPSLSITIITTRIRNLSRASYKDTIRPIQQVDPPPYLLSPDDISKFIEPFEATYGVAV
jgi:hypothetical protein